MKDIHSQINPTIERFVRICFNNNIPQHYHGHSHHFRGIHLTFHVPCITTGLFNDLEAWFSHFTIRNERGNIVIVICLFEDGDLPF